jgi:hypothetical protein
MQTTDYQKTIEEICSNRPAPACFRAKNAFRHLVKAWDIREIDPEMATFRGACAEEESAAAIFESLRRLNYARSKELNPLSHFHKFAVIPFLWAVNTSFESIHLAGFQPQVEISKTNPQPEIQISFKIPGTDKRGIPSPPFNFQIQRDGKAYKFEEEFDRLKSISSVQTLSKALSRAGKARNQLLYAQNNGLAYMDAAKVEPFLQDQLLNVTKLLSIYLLIDMHPEHQDFVVHCVDAFLKMLGKIPDSDREELCI